MKLRQLTTLLLIVSLPVLLAACGGATSPSFGDSGVTGNGGNSVVCGTIPGVDDCAPGGSGGSTTTATLTVSNAAQVAGSIIKTLERLDRMATAIVAMNKIIGDSFYPPPSAPNNWNPDGETLASSVSCDNGNGVYSLTWYYVDTPANNLLNNTYIFNFNGCEIGGEVLNGNLALTDYDSSAPYSDAAASWDMSATVAFDDNQTSMNKPDDLTNDVTGFKGSLTSFTATYTGGVTETQFTSGNTAFQDIGTGGGSQEQLLSGFRMATQDQPGSLHRWGLPTSPNTSLNGTITNSVVSNNVVVTMPNNSNATVDWTGGSASPSSGTIDVTAADATSVEIYVSSSSGNVQLTVADGTSTTTPTTVNDTWQQLLTGG